MSSPVKRIIARMSEFDHDLKDDATRLKKMRIAWENGRDADEYRRQTGRKIAQTAEECGIIHATLQRFVRFYLMYKDGYAESIEGMPLMWGHYMAVLYVREPKARDWYLRQAALNSWSTHEIRRRVQNYFYESSMKGISSSSDADNVLRVIDQKLYTYTATVLKVVDGDTLKVEVDAGFSMRYETKVRLRGIDAYERGTETGEAAKAFVEDELFGETFRPQDATAAEGSYDSGAVVSQRPSVVIRTYKSDKYGRFVADVWYLPGETDPEKILANGRFLNQGLLDCGLAVKIE